MSRVIVQVPISWLGILQFIIFGTLWQDCNISCRSKILSSWTFWLLKLSDVKPGICVKVNTRSYRHPENISLTILVLFHENKQKILNPWLNTVELRERFLAWRHFRYNFNRQKVHEDNIFERQDILQFLSQDSKYFKYIKFPPMI